MRLYILIYACVIFKVVRADIHAIESSFVACNSVTDQYAEIDTNIDTFLVISISTSISSGENAIQTGNPKDLARNTNQHHSPRPTPEIDAKREQCV